jgi:hypothetical protein
VIDLVNSKKLIGELLGALIAVAWITWALLWPGDMVGLVIALDITILCGTLAGGLFAISENKIDYKEAVGWVLGAAIGVAWITWAMLWPGDMVGLVVALTITILCGTLAGGLIGTSKKKSKES